MFACIAVYGSKISSRNIASIDTIALTKSRSESEHVKTFIYFVRHAESIFIEGKERVRGLSDKGMEDAISIRDRLVTEEIDCYISSPYERAIATIRPLAETTKTEIAIDEDVRERSIGDFSPYSFEDAKKAVYDDFSFAFPNGESSATAQHRAVKVLDSILSGYAGKKIVVGTHGDIMTLMVNFYDKRFDFGFWKAISMPDIYRLDFEGNKLVNITRLWKEYEEDESSRYLDI